jgi:hypothetical protein
MTGCSGGPVPCRLVWTSIHINANEPQWLEAVQGIVLMLSDLFFLVAFVILASNHVDFDPSLLLADGLTADRRRDPVDLLQPQLRSAAML